MALALFLIIHSLFNFSFLSVSRFCWLFPCLTRITLAHLHPLLVLRLKLVFFLVCSSYFFPHKVITKSLTTENWCHDDLEGLHALKAIQKETQFIVPPSAERFLLMEKCCLGAIQPLLTVLNGKDLNEIKSRVNFHRYEVELVPVSPFLPLPQMLMDSLISLGYY